MGSICEGLMKFHIRRQTSKKANTGRQAPSQGLSYWHCDSTTPTHIVVFGERDDLHAAGNACRRGKDCPWRPYTVRFLQVVKFAVAHKRCFGEVGATLKEYI